MIGFLSLQEGITVSHTLFKQKVTTIQNAVNTMLELMNQVILIQTQRREEAIYKRGLDYVSQENLPTHLLSEDEIRGYGRTIFKQIGIHKAKNKIDVNEFTKLKDFMNTMWVSFSGFNYLQNKIDTLFKSPLQQCGLFSSNQSALKQHELTPGIMEELMGIILKQQYVEHNNEVCGHQAMIHFKQALACYETENDAQSAMQVRNRMDAIEEALGNCRDNHAII